MNLLQRPIEKSLCVSLCLMLAVSLTACGGGESDSDGDSPATSSSLVTTSAAVSSSLASSTESAASSSISNSSTSLLSSSSSQESSSSSSIIVVVSSASTSNIASTSSSKISSVASSKLSSSKSSSSSSPAVNDCGATWYKANLTHYESYPEPGSDECVKFNGCTWAGQFYGLPDKMPESWVQANNIAAIHLKDWDWLGLKTINLRQGTKRITAKVYDGCSDSDCSGCCTQNLAGDGYLVDLEKYTMQRFGSGSGIVEFQICD